MSGSSTCKYCGRAIVWGRTPRGNNVAIDPNARPAGAYVLEATGTENGRVVFAVRRWRPEDGPEKRRASHFETCPQQPRGERGR